MSRWNATLPFANRSGGDGHAHPPAAYIVPPQWTQVIDVLAAHDVTMQRTTAAWTGKVERYRCAGMQWQPPPFEGRHPIFEGEGAGAKRGKFGTLRPLHETVHVSRRLGGRAAEPAAVEGRRALAGAGRPGLRSALGILRSDLRAEGIRRGHVRRNWRARRWRKDPALKAEFERRSQAIRSSPRALVAAGIFLRPLAVGLGEPRR